MCQSLAEVNTAVIKQFKLGERLQEVKDRIFQLVVPTLYILNHCDVARNDAASR
jgi:hypothetical protein